MNGKKTVTQRAKTECFVFLTITMYTAQGRGAPCTPIFVATGGIGRRFRPHGHQQKQTPHVLLTRTIRCYAQDNNNDNKQQQQQQQQQQITRNCTSSERKWVRLPCCSDMFEYPWLCCSESLSSSQSLKEKCEGGDWGEKSRCEMLQTHFPDLDAVKFCAGKCELN